MANQVRTPGLWRRRAGFNPTPPYGRRRPGFNPLADPNLDLFLEADIGVTNTGGRATAWADRSANARNFTSGTGPLIVAGGSPNGKTILRFAGLSADQLTPAANWTQPNSYTCYIVAKVTNSATWRWGFGRRNDGDVGPTFYLAGGTGGSGNPEPTIHWSPSIHSSGDFPTDIAGGGGAFEILRYTYEASTSTADVISRSWRAWCRRKSANNALATFGKIGSSTAGFQPSMDLCSVVGVARAVTLEEHLDWLSYFSAKWGIAKPAIATNGNLGNIWSVGDSLTLGYSTGSIIRGGWRRYLWNRLRTGAYDSEFIGGIYLNKVTGGLADVGVMAPDATWGDPCPDNDHDGVPGSTIQNILDTLTALADARDAAKETPDYIIVPIGTNDINNGIESGAPARLAQLWDNMHSRYPNARIVACTIPPFSDSTKNTKANTFNAALPALVSARNSSNYKIKLADVNANIVAGTDLETDGIHLKSQPGTGYDHMSLPIYNTLVGAW
jgi:lysophospholipase L1-like esterase